MTIGPEPTMQMDSMSGLRGERFGVARARREEDAVVMRERVGVDVVRVDGHLGACLREPAEDGVLDAVVDDPDRDAALLGEDVRLGRRYAGDERSAEHRR